MIETGDVVTAWTIALYIVTAAAGKFSEHELLGGVILTFS